MSGSPGEDEGKTPSMVAADGELEGDTAESQTLSDIEHDTARTSTKKRKRLCRYRTEWELEFPWCHSV